MSLSAKIFKKISLFEGDRVLWMVLFFLCVISIIEVYSASSNMSYKSGEFWRPATQHVLFILIGVTTTVCIHKVPCRFFKLIPLSGPPVAHHFLYRKSQQCQSLAGIWRCNVSAFGTGKRGSDYYSCHGALEYERRSTISKTDLQNHTGT